MSNRRTRVWFSLILAPLLICAAQPPFKNQKAREARAAYEEEVKKAESDYNTRILAAKRNYRARLDQGRFWRPRPGIWMMRIKLRRN